MSCHVDLHCLFPYMHGPVSCTVASLFCPSGEVWSFWKRLQSAPLTKGSLKPAAQQIKQEKAKHTWNNERIFFQNKYMMLNMGCHRIVGWLLFQKTLFPIPNLFKHDTMNTNYLFKHGMSLLLLGVFLLYHMRQSWDGQGDVFTMAVGLYWIPP